MSLRPIEPREACDRCAHEMRQHAGPEKDSGCKVTDCPCDGFFPVPKGGKTS